MILDTITPLTLEVPCDKIESVHAAISGGADRVELCSALSLGGLTPTVALYEEVADSNIDIYVMIRPREGDFNFSSEEFRVMLREIELLKLAGAKGIVSGILSKNGEIDIERCSELILASRPLPFTFHRAFDLTPDPLRSLKSLMELNADRLLTSGQSADAFSGRELISKLVKQSGNKIKIIAGAGINPENVFSICEFTGVNEIHLSGKSKKKSEMAIHQNSVFMGRPGNDDNEYDVTDLTIIRKVRIILDNIYS